MKYFIFLGFITSGQCSFAQIAQPANPVIVAPALPSLENCASVASSDTTACIGRNTAKQNTYDSQLAAYNTAAQELATSTVVDTAKQNDIAAYQQRQSAKEAAMVAEQKIREAAQIYRNSIKDSDDKSKEYSDLYNISCPVLTDPNCLEPYANLAAWFKLSALAAEDVANSLDVSANAACETAKKLSSNPGSCTAVPGGTPVIGNTAITGSTGGLSFTATKSVAPFKINKDGSITTNRGKRFTLGDFASVETMMAAGISAANAKATFAQLKKVAPTYGLDNNALLKKLNKSDASAAPTASDKAIVSDKEKPVPEKSPVNIEKRTITCADAQTAYFEGELIGATENNIFKMIYCRYQAEVALDHFINPE